MTIDVRSPRQETAGGSDDDVLLPVEPRVREIARELYGHARDLPLISPHGHIDPGILADDEPFGDPARLFVVPDHYVTRMLLSQGISPDALGVPRVDGGPVQSDPRVIWRTLASHWHLFRGTPSKLWLERTFTGVFDVHTPLRPETADEIYDALSARLAEPEFRPRALFARFNLEVLATTESALDPLTRHAKLAADGWGGPGGRVITTFRPDDMVDLEWAGWPDRVRALGAMTGCDTDTLSGFLDALRLRRLDFIAAGATSSDHGHPTARAASVDDAASIFTRGLRGEAVTAAEAEAFRGHMLVEFARMSTEDGLVMQLHPGAVRNHNTWLHSTHGRDVGGDIPEATEYTRALRPLLDEFGHDPRFRMVVYTLDEQNFSRELAPLAGGYPSVFVGAPWWFLDAPEALRRWREAVTETAGFYNTAGFVDDTRAYCSIPVRHDVARRIDAGFLARLVAEHRLSLDEAGETIADLAYHLPKKIFKVG
ncbi:glucuronate isomerase [Allocatelliglobosispora scoriae]|uniref:Uronate isomerase n=1 Tax=Allocatelliglobosispora scoriae TaxID=643052 RepID=A0A841BRH5_9ACTN|nr:glucuronate isomerase [Allocatelliglobosispora scoriae]MBB5870305.1 glucuronate isomerase [Allocatelliglobosispora scoriae]